MAEEINGAIKRKHCHKVKSFGEIQKGRKLTIGSMPHDDLEDDDGLLNKNLVYVIELRGEKELALDSDTKYVDQKNKQDIETKKKKLGFKQNKVNASRKEKKWLKNNLKSELIGMEVDALELAEASLPVTLDSFVVREYERVLFIKYGQSMGVIEPGLWAIDDDYNQTGTEIIFVDISEFQFNFGYSNITTQEHAHIGVHGNAIMQIRDPRNFVINLISSKNFVSQTQIEGFVEKTLESTIKQELGQYKALDLVHQGNKVISARVRAKINDMLEKWGLDIVNINILGLKLPPEMQHLQKEIMENSIDSTRVDLDKDTTGREISRMGMQTDIEKQKLELEKQKMELERERKLHEANLSTIDRKVKVSDEFSDIDLEEARGMAGTRVKHASIQAENTLRDHELRMEEVKTLGKGTFDREEETKKNKTAAKIESLNSRKKELNEKLDKLDDMLMNDKMNKDMHESRSKLIMTELEDIRRELLTLERLE